LLKVLIVDDELLVRIGLKSSLNWEEQGYHLVGEARNAKEAQELFDKTDPDILITDITMPGLDGLELIHLLKQKKEDLASVILTHHEDFHFAKEAISLGVVDYILKSNLTAERLREVLAKAGSRIIQYRKISSPGTSPSDSRSAAFTDLQRAFSRFCSLGITEGLGDFEKGSGRFHFPVMVCISVHIGIDREPSETEQSLDMYDKMSGQILSTLSFPVLKGEKDGRFLYLFLGDSSENGALRYGQIRKLLLTLDSSIRKYSHIFLTAGLSSRDESPRSLRTLYREALAAEDRAFFRQPMIETCSSSGETAGPLSPGSEEPANLESEITALLKDRSRSPDELLDPLFANLYRRQSYSLLRSTAISLINTIRTQTSLRPDRVGMDSRLKNAETLFAGLEDFDAVKMYLKEQLSASRGSQTGGGAVQTSFIIQKSKKYIETHYDQNISLSNLAEKVEVSRSYLSFLFKEELGINFTHYLTNVRIENAKSLLTGSNLKIYEIADKVGFDSPYYFSKVFKDICGITCKDYRRQHYGG